MEKEMYLFWQPCQPSSLVALIKPNPFGSQISSQYTPFGVHLDDPFLLESESSVCPTTELGAISTSGRKGSHVQPCKLLPCIVSGLTLTCEWLHNAVAFHWMELTRRGALSKYRRKHPGQKEESNHMAWLTELFDYVWSFQLNSFNWPYPILTP